jgi:hypothetical protein
MAHSGIWRLLGFSIFAAAWWLTPAPALAQDTFAVDRLVPYATPGGLHVRVDARLVPGLDVLRQLEVGRELVDALGQAGVTVRFGAEPRGVWAHYDSAARLIVVDESLAAADPRTLAALLSHEAVHARQTQAGAQGIAARATAGMGTCYADEIQAVDLELQVWQALMGPQGKQPADHAYEREENAALARYLAAPAQFWERLTATYARVCRS